MATAAGVGVRHMNEKNVLKIILVLSGIAIFAICSFVYVFIYGIETEFASAESPDQQVTARIHRRYFFGPLYGWNRYRVSVDTGQEIRCTSLVNEGWRGTPKSIFEVMGSHEFAVYNDFDQSERFPKFIKWISDNEFMIEGGEGSGTTFKIK